MPVPCLEGAWALAVAQNRVQLLRADSYPDLKQVRQGRPVRRHCHVPFPFRQQVLLAEAPCDLLVPAAELRTPAVLASSWPGLSLRPLASARRPSRATAASASH